MVCYISTQLLLLLLLLLLLMLLLLLLLTVITVTTATTAAIDAVIMVLHNCIAVLLKVTFCIVQLAGQGFGPKGVKRTLARTATIPRFL